ncbi:MAG: ABC transporter substrate-binding protein [Candidatus Promineifilaceae bacterium]
MFQVRRFVGLIILLLGVFFLVGCGGEETPANTNSGAGETNQNSQEADTPEAEEPPATAKTVDADWPDMSWEEVVAEANGQSMDFCMWGGSDNGNAFITEWLATRVQEEYNITINQVRVADTANCVNKVLGEKEAGRDEDGTTDLVWINGENFKTMRQGDLLFGPFSEDIPSSEYVDWSDPAVAFDFGVPVEGYEVPWASSQFVMIYNSETVPEPPTSVEALITWVQDNPGRFTYIAPPNSSGSAFIRHFFYYVADGPEPFLEPFDQAVYDEYAPQVWEILNDLEPSLWRSGETYPESPTAMDDLLANGEVDFAMGYGPTRAQSNINAGTYPESIRTFVFDEGTVGNTNYIAIPFNAPNKAAAMVVANFLLSVESQVHRMDPDVVGSLTALSMDLLPADVVEQFNNIPRGPAVLAPDVLSAHRLPEMESSWVTALETGWTEEVLQK